jgi:uncharacterized membrane-anchored protein
MLVRDSRRDDSFLEEVRMNRRLISACLVAVSGLCAASLALDDAQALPMEAPAKPAKPAGTAAAAPGDKAGAVEADKAGAVEADKAGAVEGDQAAPSDEPPAIPGITWQKGPVTGSLGNIAQIEVPAGFIFTDGDGTRTFLKLNENPTNGQELGMVMPADLSWAATFEFSDSGHVKDDEKEELDADNLLKSLREGNEGGNEQRKKMGWTTVSLIGWAMPPKYDDTTHNLEWATKVQDDGDKHITINHNIRLLGRSGVMEASLMAPDERYQGALPDARRLLAGYGFKSGHQYAEYREGDKLAQYGLTGLITGGAIAVAAKSGLLQKFGKLIVVGVAAAGAGIAKLFGRKKPDAPPQDPE